MAKTGRDGLFKHSFLEVLLLEVERNSLRKPIDFSVPEFLEIGWG